MRGGHMRSLMARGMSGIATTSYAVRGILEISRSSN
jgi:hypothetical protein